MSLFLMILSASIPGQIVRWRKAIFLWAIAAFTMFLAVKSQGFKEWRHYLEVLPVRQWQRLQSKSFIVRWSRLAFLFSRYTYLFRSAINMKLLLWRSSDWLHQTCFSDQWKNLSSRNVLYSEVQNWRLFRFWYHSTRSLPINYFNYDIDVTEPVLYKVKVGPCFRSSKALSVYLDWQTGRNGIIAYFCTCEASTIEYCSHAIHTLNSITIPKLKFNLTKILTLSVVKSTEIKVNK